MNAAASTKSAKAPPLKPVAAPLEVAAVSDVVEVGLFVVVIASTDVLLG